MWMSPGPSRGFPPRRRELESRHDGFLQPASAQIYRRGFVANGRDAARFRHAGIGSPARKGEGGHQPEARRGAEKGKRPELTISKLVFSTREAAESSANLRLG